MFRPCTSKETRTMLNHKVMPKIIAEKRNSRSNNTSEYEQLLWKTPIRFKLAVKPFIKQTYRRS